MSEISDDESLHNADLRKTFYHQFLSELLNAEEIGGKEKLIEVAENELKDLLYGGEDKKFPGVMSDKKFHKEGIPDVDALKFAKAGQTDPELLFLKLQGDMSLALENHLNHYCASFLEDWKVTYDGVGTLPNTLSYIEVRELVIKVKEHLKKVIVAITIEKYKQNLLASQPKIRFIRDN